MTDKLHKISSNSSNNFTLTSLLKIQQNIQGSQPGHILLTIQIDHRQADHPYESCYGGNWKETIKRVPQMKGTVCITELIQHVVQETKHVVAGMKYNDNNCIFYHDALTQMTKQ